jgi:hypothetical protein
MSIADIIGIIGVGLILLAYFCNVLGWISSNKPLFFILNIIGAGLACYASWMIDYMPFVILEGTWTLVSVYGLYRSVAARRSVNQPGIFHDNSPVQ